MKIALAVVVIIVVGIVGLVVLFSLDRRADRGEWRRLVALQPTAPRLFNPETIAGLPEPAQRYFRYVIHPKTPLWPVTEIDMRGQFSLGSKSRPNYQPMEARQILATPEGFVWTMCTRGGLPLSGSDTGRWTRFRVFGLVPVERLGGNPDHTRSAFGRYAAEAAIW